jgi:hypothetical protein
VLEGSDFWFPHQLPWPPSNVIRRRHAGHLGQNPTTLISYVDAAGHSYHSRAAPLVGTRRRRRATANQQLKAGPPASDFLCVFFRKLTVPT